jgi:hypothetical protein
MFGFKVERRQRSKSTCGDVAPFSAVYDLFDVGGELRRKIFVNLELQALVSSGRSTVPSRANSAAYARAASMSASVKAG